MNDILYTVHVDGTDKKFKKGTTYQEIARTYQQEYQHCAGICGWTTSGIVQDTGN